MTFIPEAANAVINSTHRQAERKRGDATYAPNEPVDFTWRLAGGGTHRVIAKVITPIHGIYGTCYRIRLSRDVHGFGSKREVVVTSDRLARPIAKR